MKTATHAAGADAASLSTALADSAALANLHAFARNTNCSPDQLSLDGKHLSLPRVIETMRQRGYIVGDPVRPQQQPDRNATTWLVDVTPPCRRARVTLAIAIPKAAT